MKKCGKAVDCDFCRKLFVVFVLLYNKKKQRQKKKRGGDG